MFFAILILNQILAQTLPPEITVYENPTEQSIVEPTTSGPRCLIPNYCLNNSTCVYQPTHKKTLHHCICSKGYKGDRCQYEVNECFRLIEYEDKPPIKLPKCSKNTYSCQDLKNDYYCNCKPGFHGKNCQVDVDECHYDPCNIKYGNKCIDGPNSYRCVCANGFTGFNCDERIDACKYNHELELYNPCKNNGYCQNLIEVPGGYRCTCFPGFYGMNCERYDEPCLKGYCQNYASCQSTQFLRYENLVKIGDLIKFSTMSSDKNPITFQNDFLIIDESNSKEKIVIPNYFCQCSNEYTGYNCQTKCGGAITDVTGLIASPNYPDFYDAMTNCHYYFELGENYSKDLIYSRINFKFLTLEFLDLEEDALIFHDSEDHVERIIRGRNFESLGFDREFTIDGNFIAISFHTSPKLQNSLEKAISQPNNKFLLWYEMETTEDLTNSTRTKTTPQNWWIDQTDKDNQQKNQIYDEQLDFLEKLTDLQTFQDKFEDGSSSDDYFFEKEQKFREMLAKNNSNNTLNPYSWSNSLDPFLARTKKYQMIIEVQNTKLLKTNFLSKINSVLELIEVMENILKRWLNREIINNNLNSQAIINVYYTKFTSNQILLDLSLIAYPELEIEKFDVEFILKKFGLTDRTGKVVIFSILSDDERDDRFSRSGYDGPNTYGIRITNNNNRARLTAGMKFTIFVFILAVFIYVLLLYLLEKRGFITYDFQNLGPETLPTLSFDASKFTKNIRNLPAFIKNLRQNYQKSAKNLVQKFDVIKVFHKLINHSSQKIRQLKLNKYFTNSQEKARSARYRVSVDGKSVQRPQSRVPVPRSGAGLKIPEVNLQFKAANGRKTVQFREEVVARHSQS